MSWLASEYIIKTNNNLIYTLFLIWTTKFLFSSDSSYKIEICPDYTNVRVFDFAKQPGSDHFLALSLCPNSIPADMQVTAHSLPIVDDRAVGGTWFQASGPLRNHIATFQLCLDQMEAFYENMHTIDELCFVVHPLAVSTKCVQRTFKIGVCVCDLFIGFHYKKHFCRIN